MDDGEPPLTAADRRAIADIRRKLDAEFRAELEAVCAPAQHTSQTDTTDSATQLPEGRVRARTARTIAGARRWARHRAAGRGVAVALLVGMLAGMVLGVIATIFWDRSTDREAPLSATRRLPENADVRNDVAVTPWIAVDDVVLLREAVEEWIEATRRGDIAAQMRFYPERVPVYYTWRNVPRDAVRAEKDKVFGAARRLVITTDEPAVLLTNDRLTAVTRFRKRYVIEGPVVRRRGEVLQELRWARTGSGWRIIGERDAQVLRSS